MLMSASVVVGPAAAVACNHEILLWARYLPALVL
jgi:hypothetical protein